ncbi:MAG: ATP-binding protein [Proteobacteria bacterium]|nr:ATP-binding protein [Pseudomonadota bacterium]
MIEEIRFQGIERDRFFQELAVIVGLCVAGMLLALNLDTVELRRVTGLIVVVPVMAGAWLLSRRGRANLARTILVYGFWAGITLAIAPNGGLRAPGAGGYPILILLAGWLLGGMHLQIVTALSFAAAIAFTAAEYWQWLPEYEKAPLPWLLLVFGVMFAIAARSARFVHEGFHASLESVTRLNDKLTAQRQVYRAMLDAQSDAQIGMLMIEGERVFYANDAVRAMVGYSAADIEADATPPVARFISIVHEDDRELVFRNLQNRLGNQPFDRRFDVRVQPVQGSPRVVEVTAAVISAVPLPRTLIMLLDVTERKQVENEVKALNSDLDARVRQRSAELALSNRDMEAFAYSLAHDLRGPLRSIAGFSQVFEQDYGGSVDAKGRSNLERIRRAAFRMNQLLDDMMSYTKIGGWTLQRETVDLSALAHETADSLRRSAPERNVEFHIAGNCVARGDAALLRRLLENLIGNAWKYSVNSVPARIEFGWEAGRDGASGNFYVRDNGEGFDMKYAEDVFAPFNRLHPPQQFEGSGIGLASVARIARRYGGRVWAESAVGQGATFRFTLE